MKPDVQISFRKGRLLLSAALTIFVAGIFAVFLAESLQAIAEKPLFVLISLLFLAIVVFFLVTFGWIAVRLFSRSPALVFRETGLVDNASMTSADFVPWTNIESAYLVALRNGTQVAVIVRDVDSVLRAQTAIKRIAMRFNMLFSKRTPIWIPTLALQASPEEIITMITERIRSTHPVADRG